MSISSHWFQKNKNWKKRYKLKRKITREIDFDWIFDKMHFHRFFFLIFPRFHALKWKFDFFRNFFSELNEQRANASKHFDVKISTEQPCSRWVVLLFYFIFFFFASCSTRRIVEERWNDSDRNASFQRSLLISLRFDSFIVADAVFVVVFSRLSSRLFFSFSFRFVSRVAFSVLVDFQLFLLLFSFTLRSESPKTLLFHSLLMLLCNIA